MTRKQAGHHLDDARHPVRFPPRSERFHRFAALAASGLGAPMALLYLADKDKQWLEAAHGIDASRTTGIAALGETLREHGEGVHVENTQYDPSFSRLDLVTGSIQARFIASAPVPQGSSTTVMGSICVIDTEPRSLDMQQQNFLKELAAAVSHELERDAVIEKLADSVSDLEMELDLHKTVMDKSPALLALISPDQKYLLVNGQYNRLAEAAPKPGRRVEEVLGPERYAIVAPHLARAIAGDEVQYEAEGIDANGTHGVIDVRYVPNFDARGQVISVTSVGMDITQRRHLERTLRSFTQIGVEAISKSGSKAQDALESARSFLGMEFAGVTRLNKVGGVSFQIDHLPEDAMAMVEPLLFHVLTHDQELAVGDTNRPPAELQIESEGAMRGSFIAVPVLVDGAVWGCVSFADRNARETGFQDVELDIIRLAASIVAQEVSSVRAGRLIAQREKELREIATTDPLTGLRNRRAFMGHLDAEIARTERYNRPLSLAIVDLDHFKAVNDKHGHPAGDHVLQHVAGIMKGNMRKVDHVCRFGGEEFAIILPEADEARALKSMNKLIGEIAAEPVMFEGHSIYVTASVGCSTMKLGDDADILIRRADEALYVAKDAGRNQVVFEGPAVTMPPSLTQH